MFGRNWDITFLGGTNIFLLLKILAVMHKSAAIIWSPLLTIEFAFISLWC